MSKKIRDPQRERKLNQRAQLAGNVALAALVALVAGVLVWVFVLDSPRASTTSAVATASHPVTPTPTAEPQVAPTSAPVSPRPQAANADGARTSGAVLNGQNVRIDLPTGAAAVGVALWFPEQEGTADTRMNESWLNAIRADGWAVASSDYHGNSWGNASAVQDTRDLIAWAQEQSGQPVRMFVAASMGATTSLNTLIGGASPSCWYGAGPVVDLNTIGALQGSANEIAAAYSGASSAAGNPAGRLAALPPTTKYRIIASAGDTLVPALVNGDTLEAYLATSGYNVTSRTATGQHGDPSHFSDEDLRTFARGCVA